MHSDSFSFFLLEFASVLLLGYLGRFLARRADQPPVLGELLLAMVVSAVWQWCGRSSSELIYDFQLFSALGVLLLLFMVGQQTRVHEILNVGGRATVVAAVGVVVPMALGFLCSEWLVRGATLTTHLFLGATLCATSVGITARVLKDLKHLASREAKIILAAAVIDDVFGLVILTLLASLVTRGQFEFSGLLKVLILSTLFVGAVLWRGEIAARQVAKIGSFLDPASARLVLPLVLCLTLAWLASAVGLAAIIGAFAAGLIVRDEHFPPAQGGTIQQRLASLEEVFAPVFFVMMGLQVDLTSFANPSIAALAGLLCVAAIVGKLACALVAGPNVDRLTVGIGMIPRGEVGLIFAGIGRTLGVLNAQVFSAVILAVIVSTLLTAPALRWSLARRSRL